MWYYSCLGAVNKYETKDVKVISVILNSAFVQTEVTLKSCYLKSCYSDISCRFQAYEVKIKLLVSTVIKNMDKMGS